MAPSTGVERAISEGSSGRSVATQRQDRVHVHARAALGARGGLVRAPPAGQRAPQRGQPRGEPRVGGGGGGCDRGGGSERRHQNKLQHAKWLLVLVSILRRNGACH